ncbi:hypothetical protein OSB04_012671, partial [Centaurea solstitialis]
MTGEDKQSSSNNGPRVPEMLSIGIRLTDNKLNGSNLFEWSKTIRIYLRSMGMASHFTSEHPTGNDYDSWLQSDARLYLQIINTIEPSVSSLVSHCEYVKDLIEYLEFLYSGRSNISRIYTVCKSFHRGEQQDRSLTNYVMEFKKVYEELNSLLPLSADVKAMKLLLVFFGTRMFNPLQTRNTTVIWLVQGDSVVASEGDLVEDIEGALEVATLAEQPSHMLLFPILILLNVTTIMSSATPNEHVRSFWLDIRGARQHTASDSTVTIPAEEYARLLGSEHSTTPTAAFAETSNSSTCLLSSASKWISGRLFSDSGPRRSTRLAGEAGDGANLAGNGNNRHKYPGSSKLSSAAFRLITIRKGPSLATECCDEGIRTEVDDPRLYTKTPSTSFSSPDTSYFEHDGSIIPEAGASMSGSKVASGASELLTLLRILGEGYRLSCLYKCQDALNLFLKLPHKHYNTGWVLSQVGKAHFELVDYLEAERAFNNSRLASPCSLEGMDIYSTVLYHLKKDMKLSYLAQELVSTDRLAPQSWCAMGNCFSLQKDHETALKNFQRAVQLNSRFAYAHTLCGHEYMALDDFENGIRSYQKALQIDARHYNAWYGLGMIYLRQERYELSEHHFRTAFQINPHSSVIISYLGTSLHALKRNAEALWMMEKAIVADKKNPLPMYQKANILVSLEDLDGALEVLEELKHYAPNESSVYALMGKIYKHRLMYDHAMLHFGLALDLKPTATDVATIKAAIEKLHVPDELEDEGGSNESSSFIAN